MPIGAWVLDQACRQVQRWQAAASTLAPLRVSVNLSGRQLGHPSLVERRGVGAGRAPASIPSLVELEITESVLMDDVEMSRGDARPAPRARREARRRRLRHRLLVAQLPAPLPGRPAQGRPLVHRRPRRGRRRLGHRHRHRHPRPHARPRARWPRASRRPTSSPRCAGCAATAPRASTWPGPAPTTTPASCSASTAPGSRSAGHSSGNWASAYVGFRRDTDAQFPDGGLLSTGQRYIVTDRR